MPPLLLAIEQPVLLPAMAVAANVDAGRAQPPRQLLVALQRDRAGEGRERQAAFLEQPQHAPDADAAAIFVHRLGRQVAAGDAGVHALALGERSVGLRIAVERRIFRPLLDVEGEVDGDARVARPLRMRWRLAVTDEVPCRACLVLVLGHVLAFPHHFVGAPAAIQSASSRRSSAVISVRLPGGMTSVATAICLI